MATYVPDTRTQRWVIISPSRGNRPTSERKPDAVRACPFCEGNEQLTPPELYRIGKGEPNATGWDVRVVPNKFPITDIHEVIIHSTNDTEDVDTLPILQVQKVLSVYRDRYRAHEAEGQVLIFCNHGLTAGASLSHPHSQLVVIPNQINLDSLTIEPLKNVVEESAFFITYCPDFSQWPYETWIAPKTTGKKFSELTDGELPDLAIVLQRTLQKLSAVLRGPDVTFTQANTPFVFNYYIYHGKNWFIRIIPRTIHRAGFELGTGLNVNVIDPVVAALQLQKTNV